MRTIKLKQTHKYDIISGYSFASVKYKEKQNYVVVDNQRVVFADEKIIQYSLFSILKDVLNLDWFNDDFVEALELDYYLGHSGEKYISLLFYNLLKIYNYADFEQYNCIDYINVSKSVYKKLSYIISNRFKDNWNKIYNSYFLSDYNPIHNYNMEETEKINSKIVRNNKSTENINYSNNENVTTDKSQKVTSENTKNVKSTNTQNIKAINSQDNSSNNSVYGFNSVSPTPTDNLLLNVDQNLSQDTTDNNTQDTTDNNTQDTINKDTQSNIKNGNQDNIGNVDETTTRNADDNFTTRNRSGNIGVTTTQKMLQEELNLRRFDLINRIMNDIDLVLCSQLY